MKDFKTVQDFFCNMHCVLCNDTFKPEGITLIKEEDNYFVVNIKCMTCDQPVGIAVVSVVSQPDLEEFDDEAYTDTDDNKKLPPINYDDVIEAHKFFSNLGSDWTKYLKKS